ncbi:MAG TPA: hypothetical protein VE288_07480 [Rubrobacteraceae bacterium]|nr:hypothetical protein [Rubrobacteraceae bacterium]
MGNAKLVVQECQDRAQPVKAVGVDAERPISEDGGSVADESLVVGCVGRYPPWCTHPAR